MKPLKERYEKAALVKLGNLREITKFDPGLQFSGIDPSQNVLGASSGRIPTSGGSARLPETGLAVGAYALLSAAFVLAGAFIRKISKK